MTLFVASLRGLQHVSVTRRLQAAMPGQQDMPAASCNLTANQLLHQVYTRSCSCFCLPPCRHGLAWQWHYACSLWLIDSLTDRLSMSTSGQHFDCCSASCLTYAIPLPQHLQIGFQQLQLSLPQ